MPGDPPCPFYVQLVQPAPAKIAKNLQKIQSFKKIFKKKPKNPSKNFFSLDWVPTKLMALPKF